MQMDAEHQNAMYNPEFVQRVLAKRQEQARIDAERREAQALREARAVKEFRVIDIFASGERIPARSIIQSVSKATGIPYAEIIGVSRKREIAEVRMIAMYEVRMRRPDLSLPAIGRIFGGRDHTTVFSAVRKIGIKRAEATEATKCA